MKLTGRKIELLAPARDAEIAIEAIRHGADAVYMGASAFGARASAGNALADVARAVEFAHQFNARIYATVNTLVYDHEIGQVEQLIHDLYGIGVDAIIVQDMSILRMNLPPIALHASTQCDLRTPEKARFLQSVGFSQLVLARELSLDETRSIADSVQVPIEAFVHGALCVS
ncbi:MAG: U32 family peptidase, partial [Muribaculaceae bacterium]|nr:U32 family peptidase [Muribaculaceae bacterium]